MELAIIWLVCGIISAMIGARKGAAFVSFVAGVFLGPFGILIALFSKGNRITCPFCKELVHKDAVVCKHCGRTLAAQGPSEPEKKWVDPVDEWERKEAIKRGEIPRRRTGE